MEDIWFVTIMVMLRWRVEEEQAAEMRRKKANALDGSHKVSCLWRILGSTGTFSELSMRWTAWNLSGLQMHPII
jgi:hypothetical protein